MNTCSWNFPNMINVAQNSVGVLQDTEAIQNRTSLLLQTEPTELYMNPDFGVGLKKFMWQYNNDNTRALVKQKIREQLVKYELCIDPEKIEFIDEGVVTSSAEAVVNIDQVYNKLNITVVMQTKYGETATVSI